MGTEEVLTAPHSPWQKAYAERFIGSVRRECLDHVIVLNAAGLRKILNSYVTYYSESRTHLALEKDAPQPRGMCPTDTDRSLRFLRLAAFITDTTVAQHGRSLGRTGPAGRCTAR